MAAPPPLTGLRVLEFAGLAPAPFAGVLFADAGADVLRIDRPAAGSDAAAPTDDPLARRKASIAVDLKRPRGVALVRALAADAATDVLIDPFRPGVLERLGLGPAALCAANPRLVYARLSGFRRDGRYAAMAGHDINYLAVSGVLALLGRADAPPTPPANLLADFAGGGLALAAGVLLALVARAASGRGQVVEASMVDGAAFVASFLRFHAHTPLGDRPRGHNLLDSGCPYYDTYATADRRYMAVGALEPRFFAALVRGLGLDAQWNVRRYDRAAWPALRAAIAAAFRAQPRDHWERVFDATDACCTPVLDFAEIQHGRAAGRESDQRPFVGLRDTPLLAVTSARDETEAAAGASPGAKVETDSDSKLPQTADSSTNEATGYRRGQGPGVEGGGYVGQALRPGEGGEDALRRWRGWTRKTDYDVEDGGLVLTGDKARL